jgi:glucokinase
MAAAIVSPGAKVLSTAQVPTPPGAGAEELFAQAVFVLEAAASNQEVAPLGLGVGCGGPMEWPDGYVSPLNIPGWRDFPLRDRLADRFAVPVRIHNDAICLTIGEHLAGSGRGVDNVMGMVVSTGVGGGLVCDGRLINGASGNAGHIGHVVVDPQGPACECGGRGCLEAVARGPAAVAWALDNGWQPSGGPTDGAALARDARDGDQVAVAAFQRSGAAVGTAVASAAALLDLDLVAIGGGLSRAGDLLMPAVLDAFERHAGLGFAARCRIVLAGGDAGLIGAAALFLAEDRYWGAAD